MKINLNPCFFSIDLPWKTILDQEGLCYNTIKESKNSYACVIVSDITKISLECIFNYVNLGGTLLISSYKWKSLTNTKTYSTKKSLLVPKKNSFFSSVEYLEIYHKIEYPKDKKIVPLDENLFIYKYLIGKGCVVIHPFDLKQIFNNNQSIRKQFYNTKIELPSEVVSKTNKGKIRKALFLCLKFLYNFKNYPLIRSNYNPENFSSIFCFRIDSDFSTIKNANKTNSLCEKYSIPATWFVETSSKSMISSVYKNFNSIEFAFHNDRHIVFKSVAKNKNNIINGLNKLNDLNIKNLYGFSAPFGEWNESLNRAMEDKFKYSSEFCYDYDNFPSFPIINNVFSRTLQIPIHPISIGRLNRSHYSKSEMIEYYLNIINEKYFNHEPIILYFHPNNENFIVLENIFKTIKSLNIKIMTMYDYYKFWIKRIKYKPSCFLKNETVFIENNITNIEILYKNKHAFLTNQAEINLFDLSFQKPSNTKFKANIKKIRKKNWRNLLYDFERYNSMRKM